MRPVSFYCSTAPRARVRRYTACRCLEAHLHDAADPQYAIECSLVAHVSETVLNMPLPVEPRVTPQGTLPLASAPLHTVLKQHTVFCKASNVVSPVVIDQSRLAVVATSLRSPLCHVVQLVVAGLTGVPSCDFAHVHAAEHDRMVLQRVGRVTCSQSESTISASRDEKLVALWRAHHDDVVRQAKLGSCLYIHVQAHSFLGRPWLMLAHDVRHRPKLPTSFFRAGAARACPYLAGSAVHGSCFPDAVPRHRQPAARCVRPACLPGRRVSDPPEDRKRLQPPFRVARGRRQRSQSAAQVKPCLQSIRAP